jgi:hypothetical protein
MNNSPYLDRPLLPLAVALPRMLEKIEAELATAGPAETRRLRQRAQLILDLLTPEGQPPILLELDRATGSDRSSPRSGRSARRRAG